MRQRWHCASLLMLIMALGVAARETPEVFVLADDVSNDGVVACYDDRLPTLNSHSLQSDGQAQVPPADPSALANLGDSRSWSGPALCASSRAGRDILRFLSFQRK